MRNTDSAPLPGVQIKKDFVLSGLNSTEEGDLTGVELTPSQGAVETVPCSSLVTLQDKIIDKDTFGGLLYILHFFRGSALHFTFLSGVCFTFTLHFLLTRD